MATVFPLPVWLACQTHPIVTLVSSYQTRRRKNEKLNLAFGRVSGNLEKGWVSFWQETDKLGKRYFSFWEVAEKLEIRWFSCGKCWPRFIRSSGIGIHTPRMDPPLYGLVSTSTGSHCSHRLTKPLHRHGRQGYQSWLRSTSVGLPPRSNYGIPPYRTSGLLAPR